MFNNISAAAALLANGATVDMKDRNNQTPLHYAVKEGNLDIAKLLIENGSKPSDLDGYMRTCLHLSIHGTDTATVGFILQVSPLIHTRDKFGSTPLHRACTLPDAHILKKLIALGADCNAKDNRSHTPLHLAVAHRNHSAIVELLQCRGLKLSEKDHLGCTPLDRALVEGDRVTSDLLLARHAERTEDYHSKLSHLVPYRGVFHQPPWHDWPVECCISKKGKSQEERISQSSRKRKRSIESTEGL
ncbi:hypothetical protein PV04_07177 [Phialophora macrospora]|uniref:Uncharacterized protein n=1 Tax=Phialophora macrospora TaxID=1851006 RepID=A0A0D2FA28_9EURO|nr:hypothetical protein PV04_07177 [Phialophora macrospora]